MIINLYLSSCLVPVMLIRFIMKLEFSRQIVEKSPNIEFHENSSSVSRVVPFDQMDRRTDMTKLIVAFGNFAKAPKN